MSAIQTVSMPKSLSGFVLQWLPTYLLCYLTVSFLLLVLPQAMSALQQLQLHRCSCATVALLVKTLWWESSPIGLITPASYVGGRSWWDPVWFLFGCLNDPSFSSPQRSALIQWLSLSVPSRTPIHLALLQFHIEGQWLHPLSTHLFMGWGWVTTYRASAFPQMLRPRRGEAMQEVSISF